MAVVYDGSEASRRALDLGVMLGGEDHRNFVALIPGDAESFDRLATDVASVTRQSGIVPRCIVLAGGVGAIAAAVAANDLPRPRD